MRLFYLCLSGHNQECLFFCKITGIAFSWIGVGLVYPSFFKAFKIGSMSFKFSKYHLYILLINKKAG